MSKEKKGNQDSEESTSESVTQSPVVAQVGRLQSALDYSNDYSQLEERSLKDYPLLLLRYWPVLVVMVFLGAGLAFYQTSKTPKLFRASTMINIGAYVPPLEGPTGNSLREETRSRNYANTQIRLLKSLTLAEKVLRENPDILKFLAPSLAPTQKDAKPKKLPVYVLESYVGLVSFSAIDDTDLVMIYATAVSPVIAARVANAHSDSFIRLVKERRRKAANVNLKFLQERHEQATEKLQEAEKERINYAEKYAISVSGDKFVGQTINNRYQGVVSSLNQAITDKVALESAYRETRRSKGLADTSLSAHVARLGKLETQKRQLSRGRASRYQIESLESEIQATRGGLKEAGKVTVQAAKDAYEAASARESFLRGELEKLQQEQVDYYRHKVRHDRLAQKVSAYREVQKSLQKRLEDALINAESNQETVSLVDRAYAPTGHISPNLSSNLWTGAMLGGLLGVLFIFLLDFVDNRVRSVRDLQQAVRTPVLGVIPEFSKELAKLTKPSLRKVHRRGKKGGTSIIETNEDLGVPPDASLSEPGKALTVSLGKDSPILPVSAPFSPESESFRGILATLTHNPGGTPRRILITSGQQGDGKTTLAVNLAASLAQMSERTLLIDADLRLPNVNTYFGLDRNTPGLTEYLNGNKALEEVVLNAGLEHLFLLPAGTACENPAALLRSSKMSDFLDHMDASYDFIILDSPPIGPVADSLLLSQHVDGVALVVRSGETSKTVTESAVSRLRQVGANVLGLVLNDTSKQRGYWKSGYSSYYHSYHRGTKD